MEPLPSLRFALLLSATLLLACSVEREAPRVSERPAFSSSLLLVLEEPYVEVRPEPAKLVPAGPLAGRRICLDPGHDARWVPGASGRTRSGALAWHAAERVALHEHELTLRVAYRLKALLEAEDAHVCVTRTPPEDGGLMQIEPYDYTGDGRVRTAAFVEDGPERVQPRIDFANDFGAEVLVSIHYNGSADPRLRGTDVYYTDAGPRAQEGRRMAESILTALLAELRAAGYAAVDRGVRSDRYQRYSVEESRRMIANHAATIRANGHDPAHCPDCYRLLTLGNNPMSLRPGGYLGVLVEVEFLSNPDVLEAFILRADSLDIVARGLYQGLRVFFDGEQ